MESKIFESRSKRKAVYKTENGIEIKPMKHLKNDIHSSQNITYYYILYSKNKNDNWIIFTNTELYKETTIIEEYETKLEAENAARVINKSNQFIIYSKISLKIKSKLFKIIKLPPKAYIMNSRI